MIETVIAGSVQAEWLLPSEAARELGIGPETVKRLGQRGKITVRQVPGVNRRHYLAADVRALAARSITPASVSA